MAIQQIDAGSVHNLCSGQVLLDLSSVVKELVENSIDAGATSLEVRFKENGVSLIEVIDNGSGIGEEDFASIGLRYHTSKISSFEDLGNVQTLGFRGEAISSLCAVANVVIQTATAATTPRGSKISFDSLGVMSHRATIARQPGTTCQVTDLFKPFPVRYREFLRNAKREFGKAVQLLYAYALTSKSIRFKVISIDSKGKTTQVLGTTGSKDILANFTSLFGSTASSNLQSFSFPLLSGAYLVHGLISKLQAGSGRGSGDRQFIFINNRPCQIPKVTKVFNEVYRSQIPNQLPILVVHMVLPCDEYDVNLTPDKRTILLHRESELVQALRASLTQFFEISKATIPLNPVNSGSLREHFEASPVPPKFPTLGRLSPPLPNSLPSSTNFNTTSAPRRPPSPSNLLHLNTPRNQITTRLNASEESPFVNPTTPNNPRTTLCSVSGILLPACLTTPKNQAITNCSSSESSLLVPLRAPINNSILRCSASEELSGSRLSTINNSLPIIPRKRPFSPPGTTLGKRSTIANGNQCGTEIIAYDPTSFLSAPEEEYNLQTNPAVESGMVLQWEWILNVPSNSKPELPASILPLTKNAHYTNPDNSEAERALVYQLDPKVHFNEMEVVGQFNLGFIIVKLDSQLFIVDQHAADEIYNYTLLHQAAPTSLARQPLAVPRSLHLAIADELVALDNLELLKAQGYTFSTHPSNPPGQRLKLTSVPIAASLTFDPQDLDLLIHSLSSHPTLGCNLAEKGGKLDAKLASQACRRSVMIGHPLDCTTMTRIVRNLALIPRPWNCPHGRPTLRHLFSL